MKNELAKEIAPFCKPLHSTVDLDEMVDRAGDKRVVMLGEASHGTHEYYTWRMALTKRLIQEKGFNFICVEGDWPDCYRLNRFIKNYSHAGSGAIDIIRQFDRWPTWMWGNWEVVALAEWLYGHNKPLPVNKKVGFYGLDVYSLWESIILELVKNQLTRRRLLMMLSEVMM